jgi:hypothetical protein
VQLRSSQKTCPLFFIITPTHDAVEQSPSPTRVVVIGQVAEHIAFFKCATTYFLFFATGSECVFDEMQTIGSLPRYRTEACPEASTTLQ